MFEWMFHQIKRINRYRMKTLCIAASITVNILLGSILNACATRETEASKTLEAVTTVAGQGWESGWERVMEAAKKEGKVSVYTQWGGTERAGLVRVINEKFGIDVEFTSAGTGSELTAKLTTERRNGLYLVDVIGQGATTLFLEMKPAGILAPIEPMLILPEVKDVKAWAGGELFLDKGKLAIPFAASFNSYLARNTNLVKEGELKSYYDLLDPRWKGKIVMRDPRGGGSGNAWILFMDQIWGWDKTRDYLLQFVKQEPILTRDLRFQAESLARGKYAISVAPNPTRLIEMQETGAPVAEVRIKEGLNTATGGGVIALPGGPLPHPNAARVFINWLLTREGQTFFSPLIMRPSRRLDVPPWEGYKGLLPLPGEPVEAREGEEVMVRRGELVTIAKEIFGPF